MKPSFVLLAAADLLLLAVTALVGLICGSEDFTRHFLLGLLSGLFTCFVHVLAFVYFIVQGKIVEQAARLDVLRQRTGSLAGPAAWSASLAEPISRLKARTLGWGLAGTAAMFLAMTLGAAIGIYVDAGTHLAAAFGAMGINAYAFAKEFALIDEWARLCAAPSPEAGDATPDAPIQ